ncbi:MAG: Nif3-like dinuclear metal center hexameric protein [Oligoflexia bacterium]|nr:Nif3-like dinuclear metal center hexameric protein [Oligoflexia bacterium]
MELESLLSYLDHLLKPKLFSDWCNNGLQVEGNGSIDRIAFAVSADANSIDQAIEWKADAMIVHHGLFWKNSETELSNSLTGVFFKKRILPLIKENIHLLAYHLPLDANMEVGHAATLARQLEMQEIVPFAEEKNGSTIGVKGRFKVATTIENLQKSLFKILKHPIVVSSIGRESKINTKIKTAGIITGRASSYWRVALNDKLDAFITGEISENDWSLAFEHGIHLFAGGHTATEELGLISLIKKIETDLKVECKFIRSQNPI